MQTSTISTGQWLKKLQAEYSSIIVQSLFFKKWLRPLLQQTLFFSISLRRVLMGEAGIGLFA
jgi:hypothetical protein